MPQQADLTACWFLQKAEEMSAYEQERAEHIARNKARMAALHLPSLANTLAPRKEARPAKQRGISSKRHKAPVGSPLLFTWSFVVHSESERLLCSCKLLIVSFDAATKIVWLGCEANWVQSPMH